MPSAPVIPSVVTVYRCAAARRAPEEGTQMKIRLPGATSLLLGAVLATGAMAGCGSGTAAVAPPVPAPPASAHTAAERAATMAWLAAANRMWIKGDLTALDRVTTGEAGMIYRAERRQAAADRSDHHRSPFRLTGLSVTVPCHRGAEQVFVAYADTDVFTLGQSLRPVALVFQRATGAWKLAAMVNAAARPGGYGWPALCRRGAAPAGGPLLPAAGYGAALARVLNHAVTGRALSAASAAPFAVNSFFAGPGSINAQAARQQRRDRASGVVLAQRFAPAADPVLALPLAAGRGYWLVGDFIQTGSYRCPAGTSRAAWPDGNPIATPRPAVVHRETDTFITTYAATDPPRAAGGRLTLTGFFGWPLTSAAR
jgi:hypothetical protein